MNREAIVAYKFQVWLYMFDDGRDALDAEDVIFLGPLILPGGVLGFMFHRGKVNNAVGKLCHQASRIPNPHVIRTKHRYSILYGVSYRIELLRILDLFNPHAAVRFHRHTVVLWN